MKVYHTDPETQEQYVVRDNELSDLKRYLHIKNQYWGYVVRHYSFSNWLKYNGYYEKDFKNCRMYTVNNAS